MHYTIYRLASNILDFENEKTQRDNSALRGRKSELILHLTDFPESKALISAAEMAPGRKSRSTSLCIILKLQKVLVDSPFNTRGISYQQVVSKFMRIYPTII
jgi:hypothetical protein